MEFRAFFADEFGSEIPGTSRPDGTGLPPGEGRDFPDIPSENDLGNDPDGENSSLDAGPEGDPGLARPMPSARCMNQDTSVDGRAHGARAPRIEPREGLSPSVAWYPEEQPDFQGGLRSLPGSGSPTSPRLRLSDEAEWNRRVVWRMSAASLASPTPMPDFHPRPPGAGKRILVSMLLLTLVASFGYLTASRSVTAFQEAWQRADALLAGEDASSTSVYRFDDARIPGPFDPIPTDGIGPVLGFLGAGQSPASPTPANTPAE